MTALRQPDLIDATELPAAFVETWRALEAQAGVKMPATLTPIFVRNLLGDTWVALRVNGKQQVATRERDPIEAAKCVWRHFNATSTPGAVLHTNNGDEERPLHPTSTTQWRDR